VSIARWFVALILLGAAMLPHTARAVDRTLGASVPKPATSGAPWSAADVAALATDIDALLRDAPVLRGAHVGVVAVDARNGEQLYAHNSDDAFLPASTLKLLTGSVALEALGTAFRFRTDAFVRNTIVDGTLHGLLGLRSNGDILLDDAALHDLSVAVRAAGIRRMYGTASDDADGPDAEQRYLPGWSWDDFAYAYASAVESLGFNDNRVSLHIVPGNAVGARATVSVQPWGFFCEKAGCRTPFSFDLVNDVKTGPRGSQTTADVSGRSTFGGLNNTVQVSGSIALGGEAEDVDAAVPSPTLFLLSSTGRAMNKAGINSSANVSLDQHPIAERILWTHYSEPLPDLLADMWLPSDNILAEELLRATGAPPGRRVGTSIEGIARENAWLTTIGIDPGTVALSDGSGLSVYDRLAPRTLTAILVHDWNGPYRDLVLDDLPIAGVRGTLETSYKGTLAEGRVFAKTGSMSHVNNLAGYAATQCHGSVAFAFLVDDWLGSPADLRDLRARVFARIIGAPC
jgi:D-alanyl-D-alanine carboxypeptidase/D-alanyl-D-alanine-endopeptidase (penicillin-binding protein 4)